VIPLNAVKGLYIVKNKVVQLADGHYWRLAENQRRRKDPEIDIYRNEALRWLACRGQVPIQAVYPKRNAQLSIPSSREQVEG
jgi:hypothetical protein